jgi:tetratricopeptide (TPR) repeat protein
MFGKDPEKLFEEVNKKWGKDFDHNKALAGYDNLLLLLESGDYDNLELKNPSDAEHTYDNLTQKAHSYKGQILMVGKKLFQEGMLEFDKAIQINPENQDMVKIKIKALETYRTEREEEDIERHPELSEEVLKCCDKLLSIDNESVAAWLSKSTSYFKLGRYEDVIECDDIILRLYQEKKTATRDPIMKVGSLVSKAICYDLLNRLTESKKCYLEVLELDPYNEKALHFLHDIEMKIAGKKPYSAMNDLERGKKPYSAMNDLKNEQDKGETKPFVKTSGNHFQDFRTLLAKSKGYYELGRYEDVLECEDVILRLISEKGMNPSQRALSLHTKANCYYFLNRLTESKKCLLEVLEFDPYNEEALTDLHDTEMKIAVKERTEKNNTSSQESESIFCENCGKPLKPTAKFCGKCGTPRA